MTSRDFAFWLQGFFELRGGPGALNEAQVVTIQRHLALVFKHEIDPSMGDAAHQADLNATHAPTPDDRPRPTIGGHGPDGTVFRC